MANGKRIDAISRYVNEVCKAFVTAHQDITNIEYRHTASNQRSYIKLSTAFGISTYFDATDLDSGQICLLLCSTLAGADVNRRIRDLEVIRAVEKLFAR